MAASVGWRVLPSSTVTYSHNCSSLFFNKTSNLAATAAKFKQFNTRSIRLNGPTAPIVQLHRQVIGSNRWRAMASVSQSPQSLASDNVDEETTFWQQVQSHQKMAAQLPAVERVRTLFDCSSSGILSTFSQKYEGYPSGSTVDFACGEDGCPILAISSLAVHTKDLLANPKCSLLVTKDPADKTDLIVTLLGDAFFVPEDKREASRACYLRKHPGAFWVDFRDFHFVRVEPKYVRFVSGVATAMLESGDFTEEEYKSAKVDPISQFSIPVASHMNRDHAGDTKLIVQHSTAIQVEHAHIIDLDRLGFNVQAGYHGKTVKLRIPFPRPAESRRDVKDLYSANARGCKEKFHLTFIRLS